MRSTGGSGGGRGAMVTSIATGTAGATSATGYSCAGYSCAGSVPASCKPGDRPFPTTTRGDRTGTAGAPMLSDPDRGTAPDALTLVGSSATAADRKVAGPLVGSSATAADRKVTGPLVGSSATAADRKVTGSLGGDALHGGKVFEVAAGRAQVHHRGREIRYRILVGAADVERRSPN